MSSADPCDPLPGDEDIGNALLIPSAIFIVPTIITTALRLWARKKSLGHDDWTILIAAILTVVLNALSIEGVGHGKGRHLCFLQDDQILEIGKYSWVNQIILFWALAFIKASVCLLVLRVKSTKTLRWTTAATIALMVTTTIVACAALMSECRPISAYWNRASGECRAPTFRIYSIWVQAAVSVLTDLTCSLLPFFILRNLQMSFRKKIGVGILMTLGAVAFVFAILRATSLSLETSDTTYDYTLTGTWMTLEANIGLIASNIGPMSALLHSWRGKKSPSYYHTSQTFAGSNARRETRHPSLDDDSDRSLCMHAASDPGKNNIISGSESVHTTTEDIPMQRLSTAEGGHAGHVKLVKA